MPFKLGSTSLANLKGIHPVMVDFCKRLIAATPVDFTVNEGRRSLAQQKKNVAKGVSKTLKSKHLTGHAVDLGPLVNGKKTFAWPPYYQLAAVGKKVRSEMAKAGVLKSATDITWGGDWKSFKDGPHWELDPSKYPF